MLLNDIFFAIAFALILILPAETTSAQQNDFPPTRPASTPGEINTFEAIRGAGPAATNNNQRYSLGAQKQALPRFEQNELRSLPPLKVQTPPQFNTPSRQFAPSRQFEPGNSTDSPRQLGPSGQHNIGNLSIENSNQLAAPQSNRPVVDPKIGSPRIDPNLSPASFSEPVKTSGLNTSLAKKLLEEIAVTNDQQLVAGQPMALLDMLANSDSHRRQQMIRQYWQTYLAWAEFRFAMDEVSTLAKLGQSANEIERLTLEAAQSAANNLVTEKQLELFRQQGRLNEFLFGIKSELLPLPTDMPVIGRYRSNFDIYAARRPMPENLRLINQWLPGQQRLLVARADTVQRCRNAVRRASRAFSQGAAPLATILQTIEMYRQNHSAFVKSVVTYNQQIAVYALSVKPNYNAPDQVAAMLIPSAAAPRQDDAGADSSQIRQASLPASPYPGTARGPQSAYGDFTAQDPTANSLQPAAFPARLDQGFAPGSTGRPAQRVPPPNAGDQFNRFRR